MYRNNKGYVEWLLDENKFQEKFKSLYKEHEIKKTNFRFMSQQDEDKYICQYLIKDKIIDGTFLELYARDGHIYSNTKILEDLFNYTGILIEPQEQLNTELKKNRTMCEILDCVVSNSEDDFLEFYGEGYDAGIKETLITDVTSPDKFLWNSKNIKNLKMNKILEDSEYSYIDFMFISTSGGEYEILKSIDWKFPIFCIFVSAPSSRKEMNKKIFDLLENNGFSFLERARGNHVFINRNYFRKELFNWEYKSLINKTEGLKEFSFEEIINNKTTTQDKNEDSIPISNQMSLEENIDNYLKEQNDKNKKEEKQLGVAVEDNSDDIVINNKEESLW